MSMFRFSFSLPEVLAIGAIINEALGGNGWVTISMLGFSILGACGRAALNHFQVEKLLEIQEKMQLVEQEQGAAQQLIAMVAPSPSEYEN